MDDMLPKDLREEAQDYVDALPDETAAGRLVTDSGDAADAKAWLAEQKRQNDARHPKPM
jgi:hypothetical protein